MNSHKSLNVISQLFTLFVGFITPFGARQQLLLMIFTCCALSKTRKTLMEIYRQLAMIGLIILQFISHFARLRVGKVSKCK